jgi:energy-coupling factor transporter ATP-binding protein EcfA2
VTDDAIVVAQGVRFSYGSGLPEVLRGVDFTVQRGEFVALLGQNGAGKTTFAKTLNGINKPTHGSVVVDGRPVARQKLADLARLVGYCYQNPDHQIFSSSVEKEVGFGPVHLGYPPDEVSSLVERALDICGISQLRKQHPFNLGRGQRQLVAVASILATNPPVLVIDEPTTGMDRTGAARVMALLSEWVAQGRTIIAITHDMDIVVEYIPRAVVLVDGRIVSDGPTQEVFRDASALHAAHLSAPAPIVISDRLAPFGVGRSRSVGEAAELIEASYREKRHAGRL